MAKEGFQMKTLVRDSCTFIEPVATSSPNMNKKGMSSTIQSPLYETLYMLCEKEIKEELYLKEAVEEEIKNRYQLLLYEINPDIDYYSCNVDDSVNTENNKRPHEDMMPPPSVLKKDVKKGGKKARMDSVVPKPRQLPTRCSTRLKGQSICPGTSELNLEARPTNDNSEFKTPLSKVLSARRKHNIALVTPGPNVDAPQTILRRPNPGETAISLSGSPLLVSSDQTSCVPQITIPLRDGRVMAVLAKDGLNPEDFPTMDSQTLSRLKMLHEFLGKL